MRSRIPSYLAGVVLGSVLLAGGAQAAPLLPELPTEPRALSPDEKTRAAELLKKANHASEKGRYKRALALADELYELRPTSRTALIRAMLLGALKRHEESLAAHLVAWHLGPLEEDREGVRQGLAKESAATGYGLVQIVTVPDGARVSLGGLTLPEGVRMVGLLPGSYMVRAELAEHTTAEATVEVVAGRIDETKLVLEAQEAVPTPPPAAQAAQTDLEVPGWVLTGIGGALIIGGAVALGVASGTASDLDAVDPGELDRYRDLKSSLETQELLGWVFGGLGVAAVVTGVVLLALDPAEGEGSTGVTPALAPAPLPGGGGLAASWRF